MATILCVDDEPAVAVVIGSALEAMGHEALLVHNVAEAMRTIERGTCDLIICDYRMPNETGLDLLTQVKQGDYQVPVILVTGYASVEHAVTAMRYGAIDYLTKPIRTESLRIAVSQALEVVRLRRENESFRREINSFRGRRAIIGKSPALAKVLDVIDTVAPTRSTVLIQGESGTGKELFARAIHEQSPRADEPFVTLNCAAMPEGLVESALFGHERGAFTGATSRFVGAFERAHRGTLLLDEISEMRLDLQAKLLRVIQEQEFERVGGGQTVQVDVRLVATTNRDLEEEVRGGRFRTDLFYRLRVVPIVAPPLRARLEDIPLLVRHFVRQAAEQAGRRPPTVDRDVIDGLQRYDWPGNVRELAHAVERAVIFAEGGRLTAADFGGPLDESAVHGNPSGPHPRTRRDQLPEDLPLDLHELERLAIARALQETGGHRSRAASLLGISERTLRNKLKGETAERPV